MSDEVFFFLYLSVCNTRVTVCWQKDKEMASSWRTQNYKGKIPIVRHVLAIVVQDLSGLQEAVSFWQ
jgi:hypothetical protein